MENEFLTKINPNVSLDSSQFTERQSAGYAVEQYRIKHDYQPITDNTYTGCFDAQTVDGTPVQIKGKKCGNLTSRSAVEMGSIHRLHKTQDFLLDVTSYTSKLGSVSLKTRFLAYISAELWNRVIPADELHAFFDYSRVFDGISCSHSDDARWSERRKALKREYKQKYPNCPVRPLFKRDHHGQKRIQFAITIADLIKLAKNR